MTFSINGENYLAVKTPANAWGIFKREPKKPNGISKCLATAQGDAELQGVLKRLFLKIVFKPLVKK